MQVKRFVAADMRRALELVRHELGSDAVILSNHRTDKGVEVLASLEVPSKPEPKPQAHLVDSAVGQYDLPMASDQAWQQQADAKTMASAVNAQPTRAQRNVQSNLEDAVAGMGPESRGQASGKTRAELAEEVEQARNRMMSAKEQPTQSRRPEAPSIAHARSHSAHVSPAPAYQYQAPQEPQVAQAQTQQAHAQQQVHQQQMPQHMQQPQAQVAPSQAQPMMSPQQGAVTHMAQPQGAQAQASQVLQPQLQLEPQYAQHVEASPQYFQPQAQPQVQATAVPGLDAQVDHNAMAQRQLRAPTHPAPVRPQAMDVDDKMKLLMAELSDMRSLLEEQIAHTTSQAGSKNPVLDAVKTRLQKLGLSQSVTKQILGRLNQGQSIKESWNEALSHLTQSIPVLPKDITEQGGVFAFVGPTGVGKTTTVGKLAARYVMKHGADQVALITTDTYRIAAHDQLRALGAILKVPVKVVEEDENLKEVIDSFSNRSLILIDTAGFRHGDPMLHQQLALVQQHRSVRSYLVMAANNQWQMLKASAHAYAGRGLSGAVLSKLDETTGLGEALSVIIEHDLPLAYSTDGQNIPQDISVARSQQLVSTALELGQINEPLGNKQAEA